MSQYCQKLLVGTLDNLFNLFRFGFTLLLPGPSRERVASFWYDQHWIPRQGRWRADSVGTYYR